MAMLKLLTAAVNPEKGAKTMGQAAREHVVVSK